MATSISFDSNDLQTANILTSDIYHESLPTKDANLFSLANSNKSAIPNIDYPNKTVRISGKIIGSSITDLDSRLDTFRGYFLGKDKNLDIGYNGSTRRYIATLNTISINRPGGLQFAEFDIEFVCTNPFGLDTSTTNLWTAKTAFSSATFTETPTIGGTAPFQLPIITITINSLTGAGDYIQISNDNNNQELLIYGQGLVADDVIVIDCSERIVTLNGDIIDYNGTFLELEPGANSITYTDGFTTRDVDVSGVYTKRWL